MKHLYIFSVLLSVAVAQSNFVCYFPNWSTYRSGTGKYTTANIDPMKCTHLVYAFAVLDPTTYTMKVYDSWADIDLGGYAGAVALKQKNPKLKVMIAIGGWNDSQGTKYSTLVSTSTAISNFVTKAVSFLGQYGFDGLDLDWEYPSTPADKAGFTALCKALKGAFQPKGYILTAAVGASAATAAAAYDLPNLALYLDFLNLMSYDMHGAWETGKADHHAPLYKRTFEADGNNINYVVNYIVSKGFPASKIVMGIPLYGRGWALSGTATTIPAPAGGACPAGPYTQEAGYLGYYEICTYIKNGWTKVSDPAKLNGPYAYSLAANSWVGFDDPEMASYKVSYIKTKGLAGAMVWDMSMDDFNNVCGTGVNPVMSAIANALSNATVLSTSTTAALTTIKAATTVAPATTTKAAATTAKPTGLFVCTGDGLYPDPATCTKFYNCANGIAYSTSCPTGLYFNPTVKVCDWPQNVPSCSSGR